MGTLTKKQKERIQQSVELMQKVQPMKIDELLPYQRNQKDHPEEQIRNLANSLRRFGWRQPVVIDENNVIVIGHGRVLAAKELGMDTAPVISAADLTEDEIRELRIIDNKTNESAWNEYLQQDLQELTFEGFDLFEEPASDLGGGGTPVTAENTSREYGEEEFSDDKFENECPRCGFKFNGK